ncbi:hypothetical protein BD560DRAFT_402026 [Blakeslea trispora]|nr:hypothetical protein BD560DRAFT_402026 [Blakeslea trispora]
MPLVSNLKREFAIASTVEERERVVKRYAASSTNDELYFQGLIILQKIYQELSKRSDPNKLRNPSQTEKDLIAQMKKHLNKLTVLNFDSDRFNELSTRFHLLIYPIETNTSIEFLKEELQLDSLDALPQSISTHSANSVTPNHKLAAPSVLNPQMINGPMLLRKNLILNQESYIEGLIQPSAFSQLSSFWEDLSDFTRSLLICEITKHPFEHIFGDKIITFLANYVEKSTSIDEKVLKRLSFRMFTLGQMNRLLQALPQVTILMDNFINDYLLKLAPEECPNLYNSAFWDDDEDIIGSYLGRLQHFASGLPEFYQPLKSAIAFHQLRVDIVRRDFNENRFLKFISLNASTSSKFDVSSQFPQLAVRNLFQNRQGTTQSPRLVIPFMGSCDISKKDRDNIVQEYLIGLVEQNKLTKTVEELGSYLDYTNFIKPLYAYVMLTTSPTVDNSWISMLGDSSYQQLITERMVTFAPQTLHHSVKRKPWDPITLSVRTKNIKQLTVRVYEIDSENYRRFSLNSKADNQIELEGILPTFEKEVDFSNESSLTIKTTSFTFGGQNGIAPEIFKGRGIWVIEFVGGENQCRTIVQKGYLRHVIQETVAGHVLRIIDEENAVVENAKVWYNNRYYEVDESKNIIIPYLQGEKKKQDGKIMLISCDDGFSESVSFVHLKEELRLDANFYVNSEMVYPNKKASVVVLPKLTLNGTSVPLSLLEQPSLTIDVSSSDSAKHSIVCQNVGKDLSTIYYEFMAPDQLHSLHFHFRAKAYKMDGTLESFHKEHTINYNSVSCRTGLPAGVHLTKTKEGNYVLNAFGKNGEAKSDYEISLRFKHAFLKDSICVPMKTSAEGLINLGQLEDICYFEYYNQFGTQKQWQLQNNEDVTIPKAIVVPVHTEFKIPCTPSQVKFGCALYRLGYNSTLIEDVTACVQKTNSYLEVKELSVGNYVFHLYGADGKTHKVICRIVNSHTKLEGRFWTGWIVDDKYFGKFDADILKRPLMISKIKHDSGKVEVQIKGNSTKTYVVATVSTFFPTSQDSLVYKLLSNHHLNMPSLQKAKFSYSQSIFLNDRRISDEYQYILNRSKSEKYVGSNLTKPSLLLYPKKIRDTVTNTKYLCTRHSLKDHNSDNLQRPSYNSKFKSSRSQSFGASKKMAYSHDLTDTIDTSLAFLNHHMSTVAVRVDAKEDTVIFDLDQLGPDGRLLQFAVISDDQFVSKQIDLLHTDMLHKKDLRQPDSANKPLVRARAVKSLMPAETLAINTREFAVIDSFEKLFDTIQIVSGAGKILVDEFEFLRSWPTLSLEKKLKIHEEKVCHELNLWLKKKDVQFFNTYVKPVIKSKIQKSFMDCYLLDEDLTPYCRNLYDLEKLNVAEKALLASVKPDAILEATLRNFKDNFDNKQLNYQFNSIFESVLAGNSSSNDTIDNEGFDGNSNTQEIASFLSASNPSSQMHAPLSRSLFSAAPPVAFGSARPSGLFGNAVAGSSSNVIVSTEQDNNEEVPQATSDENNVEESESNEDDTLLELRKRSLQKSKKSYKFVEKTSEWKDATYYDEDTSFQLKQFWIDYLESVRNNAVCFLPESFMSTLDNLQEIFYVLSLMDLPFASQTDWKIESASLNQNDDSLDHEVNIYTYCQPVIVFYRTLVQSELKSDDNNKGLILAQEFFVLDNFAAIDSEECIKFDPSTQSLLPQVEYGQHLTITNITCKPIDCQVTFQVPTGAVPVQTSSHCKSQAIRIEAYSTWHEIASIFYFPIPGEYATVPVTIASASGDSFLGALASAPIRVVETTESMLDQTDATNTMSVSWSSLAARGSDESVLAYVDSYRKLHKLDLHLIGWRMANREFARKIFGILANRQYHCYLLGIYAVQHRFDDVICDLIHFSDSNIMDSLGKVFESPLITKNDLVDFKLNILDYYPLLNARAHPFQSSTHEILNQEFYEQYDAFLEYLSLKNTRLTVPDLITLTIYLLLQDHISEAQTILSRVPSGSEESTDCQVQIDYLNAYLKTRMPIDGDQYQMQQLDLQPIKDIAQKYKDFGALRWRNMFSSLYDFVCEVERGELLISTDSSSNLSVQSEPLLEFNIDHQQKELVVQYANVKTIDVKFYEMNIEAMFSSNPFMNPTSRASKLETSFTWTKPSHSISIELPEQSKNPVSQDQDDFEMIGIGQTSFLQTTEIPFDNVNKNLFIEIAGGDIKRYQVHYANKMHVHISESLGIVRVMSQETKRPLAGAYVKVYVRLKQWGGVQFWKDGYTGLNGVFDYISVTSGNILISKQESDLKAIMQDRVDKLSILVLSEEDGALVKEAYPPYSA